MTIYNEAENLAEATRKKLGLGNAPIKDIFSLLESQGIFVVISPIDSSSELSGAFYYDSETDQSNILINSNRSNGHQRFTAAHEFCHHLLDRKTQPVIVEKDSNKSNLEKRANSFAANFLMPSDGISYYIQNVLKTTSKKLSDENLAKLREEFGVSWSALLYRLSSLNYVFDCSTEEMVRRTPLLNSWAVRLGYDQEQTKRDGEFKLSSDYTKLAFDEYFNENISLEKLSEFLRKDFESTKDITTDIRRAKDEKSC